MSEVNTFLYLNIVKNTKLNPHDKTRSKITKLVDSPTFPQKFTNSNLLDDPLQEDSFTFHTIIANRAHKSLLHSRLRSWIRPADHHSTATFSLTGNHDKSSKDLTFTPAELGQVCHSLYGIRG